MKPEGLIRTIQAWFSEQCDGDWEHASGITITTLDNPGWSLVVDLEGTSLAGRTFNPIKVERSEEDWFTCRREGTSFRGWGGPANLEDLLRVFAEWCEQG